MRRIFVSLMLTLTAFIVNAQPSAIAPCDYQQMLKKGIDVDWWGRSEKNKYGAYSETAIKRFAQQGIKHVRFRLHHYHFTDEDFKRLFSQINTCMQNDLIPIIAFSAKPYKENPNVREHEKVVEWWKRMAEKCKNLSPMVSFNLIVEPSDQVKKDVEELNSLYEDCVTAIRKTNPKRIVFIAPPKLSHPEGLKDLKIPSMGYGYLMAEWHFYAAGPSKSNDKKRWTTGTAEEKQKIKKSIKVAVDWQKKTGIYTWVGAWMPGAYNKDDNYSVKEQTEFASFMTQQLDKHGVPFAINADHHFYDYKAEQWIPKYKDLLNTIFM
ncbi:glycosyl hydrolase family 5 [Prevotella sp. AM42-24]|uniref:glycoside hydrolase family 5 protein n=1 Tax=Prevotella sp. AM42-24 TaxID=2293125 RepID=UPI000E520AB8|nr:cellulase family glycosylhydrolase [Prevotella sp. AM42-24]RGH37062.1 glycosyl hydrolase family 5 [Prevotella sp. AM42-24]